jgi:hypothetical protein
MHYFQMGILNLNTFFSLDRESSLAAVVFFLIRSRYCGMIGMIVALWVDKFLIKTSSHTKYAFI